MLDRNINLFCKRFYGTWEQDEDKISFWDEVRFVLQTLPMKRDYKIDSEKQEEKYKLPNPESAAKYFVPCSLCWRSVYRLPLEKYTPLCHLHDIPSTFPEYRKRKRLKKHVEILKLKLIKSLPPLTDVKRKLGTEPSDYVKSLCLNSEYLPHLAKYLCSLSLPLNSNKEILEALEHPIYLNKIGAFKAQAWKYYLDDKAKHFLENYLKILAAEAWLRAEAEHKHGGKRR